MWVVDTGYTDVEYKQLKTAPHIIYRLNLHPPVRKFNLLSPSPPSVPVLPGPPPPFMIRNQPPISRSPPIILHPPTSTHSSLRCHLPPPILYRQTLENPGFHLYPNSYPLPFGHLSSEAKFKETWLVPLEIVFSVTRFEPALIRTGRVQ